MQIHLKDTRKVSSDCKGQFRDLVIGEGQVDFPAIFRTLAEMQYNGPMVLEMWAQDEHWVNNLRLAKSRLESMSQEAGMALA